MNSDALDDAHGVTEQAAKLRWQQVLALGCLPQAQDLPKDPAPAVTMDPVFEVIP